MNRFDTNILVAARRLKSQREDPTDNSDGLRFTSILLTEYQNRAIRDILKDQWDKLGAGMSLALPEYVDTKEEIDGTTGFFAMEANQFHFVELVSTSNKTYKRPTEDILRIRAGQNPLWVGVQFFYEENRTVFYSPVLTVEEAEDTLTGRFIKNHVDVEAGVEEEVILLPFIFDGEIVDRMVDFALKDTSAI